MRVSARKQIKTDLLQFILAKQIGSKCHIVMWIEHIFLKKKVISTSYEAILLITGAGGGSLESHWNCLETAQVDSVLRWITNLCNFPKRQIGSHCKDKGVFLLPNTLSDMVVGLVFLPCFEKIVSSIQSVLVRIWNCSSLSKQMRSALNWRWLYLWFFKYR